MRLAKPVKEFLRYQVKKFRKSGIDPDNIKLPYLLTLKEPYDNVYKDIEKYGVITNHFGPDDAQWVAVSVPINKLVRLLEKDYVKKAEESSPIELFSKVG